MSSALSPQSNLQPALFSRPCGELQSAISADSRMPTIDEVRSFDPAVAWDRLSPDQQRAIGLLAVEFGVIGGLLSFENNYTEIEGAEISQRSDEALAKLCDCAEPFWQFMFGWLTPEHHRFSTLAEAEAALKSQGFHLLPNTCNWVHPSGSIDAGVYEAEKLNNDRWSDACSFRIEYRKLEGANA